MKIVICTPTYTKPHPAYVQALEDCVPALDMAGIEHKTKFYQGSPYISHARAEMLRQAMDTDADAVVFIDHDISWRGQDIVKLITTDGDVCAGTYRFKKPEVEYMATVMCNPDFTPRVRASDGAIYADKVPAGFLKVTRNAVRRYMRAYPELCYGDPERPSVDLFQHGAHDGVWFGEDYAFSRRWRALGDIMLVPDLDLDHHSEGAVFKGNFHRYMLAQPGGSESSAPSDPLAVVSPLHGQPLLTAPTPMQ